MPAFQTPVDIGNRALQHCGANSIVSFTEVSRNAKEVSRCYDKLREAELQANVWTFATRRAVLRAIDPNTMILSPALWSPIATYFRGSVVTDQSENLWISAIPNNLNNDPLLTNFWEPYFGPLSVSLFASSIAYYAGELVYTTSGDGKYRVYLSLQSGNSDVPGTATAWSATTTFFKNQVVTYLSVAYMSLIDLNTNNIPAAAPALWNIATVYAIGNTVGGSDGVIWTSVSNGNVGNDPTLDAGTHWTSAGVLNPWTMVFVGGTGSAKWLEIGGAEFPSGVALTTPNIIYPIGAGPSTQQASRNVFKLPANFLREAPQNPKGTTTWLGGPSGNVSNDWNYEAGYLVSAQPGPISYRFVADFTDVRRMDAMFCEALASSIAFAVCDVLTQDKGQIQLVANTYKVRWDTAKRRNAIEQGYEDPPDDEYVSVRL